MIMFLLKKDRWKEKSKGREVRVGGEAEIRGKTREELEHVMGEIMRLYHFARAFQVSLSFIYPVLIFGVIAKHNETLRECVSSSPTSLRRSP